MGKVFVKMFVQTFLLIKFGECFSGVEHFFGIFWHFWRIPALLIPLKLVFKTAISVWITNYTGETTIRLEQKLAMYFIYLCQYIEIQNSVLELNLTIGVILATHFITKVYKNFTEPHWSDGSHVKPSSFSSQPKPKLLAFHSHCWMLPNFPVT